MHTADTFILRKSTICTIRDNKNLWFAGKNNTTKYHMLLNVSIKYKEASLSRE